MTSPEPEPELEPKPKRKRRTKAEIEAERQAQMREEAAKPIDPVIWIILGGLILFLAFWAWVDPIGLTESGNNPSIFQFVPAFLGRFIGQTAAAIVLTVAGIIPLVWGIIGWLRKRAGASNSE